MDIKCFLIRFLEILQLQVSSLTGLLHLGDLTGECPKVFEELKSEKGSKSGNFQANLVEFRVEKGSFLFVTHCYIWAFSS